MNIDKAERDVINAAMRGFDYWRTEKGVTLEQALVWKGTAPPRQALIRACARLAKKRGAP